MKNLEIIKTDDAGYTIIVDGLFADYLTVDEALGCVASALFGTDRLPLFCGTYERWLTWHKKYRDDDRPVMGLLEHKSHFTGGQHGRT